MILPLLRTRRWIAFTALVVGVIIAFGLLSHWQWSRAEQKRQEQIALYAAIDRPPTPLSDGPTSQQWRHVTVAGAYEPSSQVLVRKRPLDARNGFWVLTALKPDDGDAVWVNRGWIPATGDALSTPVAPAPPVGEVTIDGYLRAWEDADPDANSGLPLGQIAAPAPALLPPVGTVFPGYVQLESSSPAQDELTTLPLPDVDSSRNISYAIQWLLFAAVAIVGWYFFLRREALEDAARASASERTTIGA